MVYAAEKLTEPETSIKQIAYELNFSDAFHFSRVFKSYFGVPPRDFIKLRR
jgi:AraC-like DNA-binding protein